VLAAVGIVAFTIDRRLVREIGRAGRHKLSALTGGTAGVNMDINR
jgi:hypothetical protein